MATSKCLKENQIWAVCTCEQRSWTRVQGKMGQSFMGCCVDHCASLSITAIFFSSASLPIMAAKAWIIALYTGSDLTPILPHDWLGERFARPYGLTWSHVILFPSPLCNVADTILILGILLGSAELNLLQSSDWNRVQLFRFVHLYGHPM